MDQTQASATDDRVCRFCLESDGGRLVSPCNCKGSVSTVHIKCLDTWMQIKRSQRCPICTATIPSIHELLNFESVPFENNKKMFYMMTDASAHFGAYIATFVVLYLLFIDVATVLSDGLSSVLVLYTILWQAMHVSAMVYWFGLTVQDKKRYALMILKRHAYAFLVPALHAFSWYTMISFQNVPYLFICACISNNACINMYIYMHCKVIDQINEEIMSE
jgi:hypothetical protein